MRKSKVRMPKDLEKKCHVAIHSATAAAAAEGAFPIPMSDAIPITATQIGMVIALGKIFDITLTEAAAKSIMGVTLTQQAGRAVVANLLKAIPGVAIAGIVISATTAAALTEALGWIVADDFYRMANGQEPEDIIGVASDLKGAFNDVRIHK